MKKYFVIFLFFISFSFGEGWCEVFAQSNTYKLGPNKMVINLEASTQKFELPVKDVKTKVDNELTYSWYKSNQIMQTKGGYDGKLLHGAFAEFYLNNNLKEKGNYKKGLKKGEWKTWYENGQLKEIIKYNNGLIHGKYQSYNEKGELTLDANYKKGKLHGETIRYEKGKNLAKHKYKNGNEVFPKPEKIKEEKKSSWKFWQKQKSEKKNEGEKQDKKEPQKETQPEKKNSPKDNKTSKG